MTRDEFKIIVKAIKGAYARCPITTQHIFDEWYTMLGDMDYMTVSRNLKKHIRTNKFAPTIAELRNEMPKGFSNFTGRNYEEVGTGIAWRSPGGRNRGNRGGYSRK